MKLITWIAILAGFVIFGFFMVDTTLETENGEIQNKRALLIQKAQRFIQRARAVMRIDSMRVHSRQKVLRIMNRFNPHMSFQQKRQIADRIYEMTVKYPNLGVELICATITHETGHTWNPRTVSDAGAMGLMQIMPRTGKHLAKREGFKWTTAEDILFDPIYNIRLGSRYMSGLIKAYELEGGLAAYNGGLQRAEKWLASNKSKGVLFEETREYVPLVLKWYDRFQDISM